jgi:hypothetical protein
VLPSQLRAATEQSKPLIRSPERATRPRTRQRFAARAAGVAWAQVRAKSNSFEYSVLLPASDSRITPAVLVRSISDGPN